MTPLERYLEVVARLQQIAPGLLDHAGSPEPAGPPPDPAALAADAAALREELAGERWIEGQLAGIEAACEVLAGARIPYRELVQRCYGVTPAEVAEERFAAAHERLDAALPGRGDVRERYAAWLGTQLVPAPLIVPAVQALAAELGARTRERFDLPDGEGVEVDVVDGELWFAYAVYEGGLRSHISINTELPIHAFDLLELVAHEIYPGHHTEHVLKEPYFAAFVYPTPQALISEGIAMLALDQLLGDDAHAVGAACLRPLGIGYDVQVAAEVAATQLELLPVRAKVAMWLDEDRVVDTADVVAYVRRWLPEPDPYAEKIVQRMRNEPWPPYESCYPEGRALCRAFCEREPDGFRRLLTEPLTTEDVSERTLG